MVKLFT